MDTKNKIDKEKIARENTKRFHLDEISSISSPEGEVEKRRRNILKESESISGIKIEGYDFDKGVDYKEIVKSFGSTGFQASHLWKAIEITNKMIEECDKIYLGYTSNMISSGLRDVIRYLVKHKKVDVCVTSGGGVEEDIIKCLGDCVLGDFRLKGAVLREKGINRIGNILAPNGNYVKFEEWIMPVLEELYEEQKKLGRGLLTHEIVWKLGERINDEKSICYWAWKNGIKIYCPTIMDGSLGDMIYFFKYKKGREDTENSKNSLSPELSNNEKVQGFCVDIASDTKDLNDSTIGLKKSGVLILGGGVIKHSILNAHLYRGGADYAVYINTSAEFDGSDAGALPEEAVSWGKLTAEAERIKVFGDATILFPILVAESFAKK